MSDRPLIRLNPGADRRVRAGHPWAFSNEIAMTPALRAMPPGSVVRLEGADGWRFGTWHFNPHSLIAARRLDPDPAAAVDEGWFGARLSACLALRDRLFGAPFYRLVHAEADGLPGLVIDRYGDAVAIQANTAGMDAALPMILPRCRDLIAPRTVVGRNDSGVRVLEGLKEEVGAAARHGGTAVVEEGGCTSRWTCSAARRPAGSSTSARTARSSRGWRRGGACWMPSAISAASGCRRRGPARGR
jgi:23S rRNA (cytosine1962-C5)-methyltransferase